jgi:hypothetical protein
MKDKSMKDCLKVLNISWTTLSILQSYRIIKMMLEKKYILTLEFVLSKIY